MKSSSRTAVLAAGAAAVAVVLSALGTGTAAAAVRAEPLVETGDVGVQTGDLDLLEDVLEHISVPFGHEGALTHQLYDSRATDAG
ncbi:MULTISPECIES: hypothetical protein [Streptomyces]|uniref:Uncharacterized protein n=1 Tax=Streptomyces apricus TaxID=1828112 RepID=A0A5B0AP06_9ACTN|nr:hypothetical protein [Streptomyces apricus]KAA0930229.1 hypothetical protein FGF04_26715 [Streptomyces apricus]